MPVLQGQVLPKEHTAYVGQCKNTAKFQSPVIVLTKPSSVAAGGAGGNPTYKALQGADAAWSKVKAQKVVPAVLCLQHGV